MLSAILKQEGDWFLLQTQYNMLLVKLLNSLPRQECSFRAENRCYYINNKHKDSVLTFLDKLGYQTTFLDENIQTNNKDNPYYILGLLDTATKEVCEAAFKALAKANHPDYGGNTETMQTITEAWNKIKLLRGM